MVWPEFVLRNVFKVIASNYETKKSELDFSSGSSGADPSQQASLRRNRIQAWARASGGCIGKEDFIQSLNGLQVGAELDAIFRETPSFGRSLARRLQDFHRNETDGPLQLIGGGGEAVVFFDEENQDVIKLFSIAGKAGFGWEVSSDLEGCRTIVPGTLTTGLRRYARSEELFPSGLEIDKIDEEGQFLLMRQPFIQGENPLTQDLEQWMYQRGWEKFCPLTESRMLANLSWKKDEFIATDVRSENVIKTLSDGEMYSIDFIISSR